MQRIIDSHFHIWDPSIQPLSWLDGTDGSITRRYDMDCLKRAYASYNEQHPDAAVNFIGGVYVEVDTDDTSLEDRLLTHDSSQPCSISHKPRSRTSGCCTRRIGLSLVYTLISTVICRSCSTVSRGMTTSSSITRETPTISSKGKCHDLQRPIRRCVLPFHHHHERGWNH